jgi:hypothetical protein
MVEGGTNRRSVGAYSAGDRLRVDAEGGKVRYRRNSILLYESILTPTYPLLLDTSLLFANTIGKCCTAGTLQ